MLPCGTQHWIWKLIWCHVQWIASRRTLSFHEPLHSYRPILGVSILYQLLQIGRDIVATSQWAWQWMHDRMRTKNSTHIYMSWTSNNGLIAVHDIYMSWTSNNGLIAVHDLYCCLMTQCEALHTCCSGFPITTQWYCSQIKLNFHFRTKDLHINLKFKLQIGIQFLWGIWCCNTNCIKCCSWSVKCSASFLVHVGVIKLVLGTVLPTWGEKLTVTKQFNIFG